MAFFGLIGGNPCSEASCGLVTFSLVLKTFQVVFGVLEPRIHHLSFSGPTPFRAPKTLRFKGKMANFEAKNTIKQWKKHQKDKWYPFHACTGGG